MAFFECKNCKKVWQYPIKKCPECFSILGRVKSKKAKVICQAKVSIPSLFHSKTPYFVLVLEDENKNKWILKSEKEYKIGQELENEIAKDKEAVSVWRMKYDFLEAIEKVLELLGGINLNENSKILILPTLEKASHPYFRDNTSPEFLASILAFLFQMGVKPENIKVCAQSFDEIPIEAKAQKSELLKVCQQQKVAPINLSQGNFVKKGDLEISEEALKVNLILNLAILKFKKAQASENLFYLLKKENFLAQKYLYSEKEILEKLQKELPEILTIAEANHIQDEKGFTHYLNLVFASFDPKNLDLAFFKITNQQKLPEILEDIASEEIVIVGRKPGEV
ncbi:hypothetical protein H5T58_01155 [Candidatus Parcubacteria bacterium]|nr:hypothetical protein [Candidatus Parcubacteria bacterium]